MKSSKELLETFKSHLNTKIIIACFVLEFVILTVLLIVVANVGIKKEGSYALREILSNAGGGSVAQYADINSVASGDSTFESVLGKYATEDISLISSVSPSFAGFLKHEFNVNIYIDGVKDSSSQSDANKPSTNVQTEKAKYKYYQFVLNSDSYHSEVIIDDSASVPAGVQIDNYNGSMTVKSHGEDFKYGRLTITNPYHVPDFDLKKILKTPLTIPINEDDSPSVLIYYTHTSEGYCSTEADKYDTKNILTSDTSKNVVACGNTIENILKNKHGVGVLNDTTRNDTDYNAAYDSSEALLQDRLAKNKSIDIAIDIHRDSFVENGQKIAPTVSHDGKTYAPLLFVMGSNCIKENDNWESNIKLAMLLIEKMEAKVPGITKGISLRKDTYLSEYANKGLLIEIGFSGNYTEEATNTAEVFAEALGEVYGQDER